MSYYYIMSLGVSKALGGSSCEFFAYVKINESPLHFSLTVFL